MGRILYGRRTVTEYLRSEAQQATPKACYLSESLPAKLCAELKKRHPDALFHVWPKKKIDERFPDCRHQGVVLQFHGEAPVRSRLSDWKEAIHPQAGLLLLLDRIQDPQNLGGILRSAEALGVRTVFLTGKGASITPAVEQVSAGALFHLNIHSLSSSATIFKTARQAGYWICASVPPEQSEENIPTINTDHFDQLPETDQLLLVLSHEGAGTKPLILKEADYLLTIPLRGQTSSLNVNVACSILLENLLRRRPVAGDN